jgi:hypothetical protein
VALLLALDGPNALLLDAVRAPDSLDVLHRQHSSPRPLVAVLPSASMLNDSGVIVGQAPLAGTLPLTHHTVLCTPTVAGGGYTTVDLGPLGSADNAAYAINQSGQVVGKSDGEATLWSADGTPQALGLAPASLNDPLRSACMRSGLVSSCWTLRYLRRTRSGARRRHWQLEAPR